MKIEYPKLESKQVHAARLKLHDSSAGDIRFKLNLPNYL